VIDVMTVVVQGLVTLLFAFVGSYVMWKIAGPRVVIKALQERMGPILMNWFITPIPNGATKSVVNEEGEEEIVPVQISPMDQMMTAAGETLYRKLLGKMGGDKRKVRAVQDDIVDGLAMPGNPLGSLLQGINPRLLERALKDGDYVPILLEQFGPIIQRWAEQKVNSMATNIVVDSQPR
jgi:hypothetical protein